MAVVLLGTWIFFYEKTKWAGQVTRRKRVKDLNNTADAILILKESQTYLDKGRMATLHPVYY